MGIFEKIVLLWYAITGLKAKEEEESKFPTYPSDHMSPYNSASEDSKIPPTTADEFFAPDVAAAQEYVDNMIEIDDDVCPSMFYDSSFYDGE